MCLWVPKKNKLVILLSTGHKSDEIGERGKAEIVELYVLQEERSKVTSEVL